MCNSKVSRKPNNDKAKDISIFFSCLYLDHTQMKILNTYIDVYIYIYYIYIYIYILHLFIYYFIHSI